MTTPEVTCVVDLSVRRGESPGGWVQVRSSQALRGGWVTAVTSAGSRAEVACWAVDEWATRLARFATVPVPEAPVPPPEPDGSRCRSRCCSAPARPSRTHRPDVLDELVRPGGLDRPRRRLRERLVRLHTDVVGRLLAVVASRARSSSRQGRAGWVSWLLFADGWRALTPTRVAGRPSVRVDVVEPSRLGAEVARLVSVVRGRP